MSESKSELKEMRREEIRGLFTLGLMAILVALRVSSEFDVIQVWRFKNIPLLTLIDWILFTWGSYAFCMVFAYSDLFSLKTRNAWKDLGHSCLALSLIVFIIVGLSVILTNLDAFFLLLTGLAIVFLVSKVYVKLKEKITS